MENPRPEKVAVVDEVRRSFDESGGALLTEYRGLDVGALAELRRSLREVGGEYRIFKNTLVRRAVSELDVELDDMLTGPTAIAFVGTDPEGRAGDAAAVAKALQEFAKTHEALVVKGGLLGGKALTAADAKALAELPSKDVLLGQFAGMLQAPMTRFARLLGAMPAKFAYGLQALIDAGGAPGAPIAEAQAEAVTEPEPEPESTPETEAAPEPDATPSDPETENQES
jgi:large subunit ribosomal protein L10